MAIKLPIFPVIVKDQPVLVTTNPDLLGTAATNRLLTDQNTRLESFFPVPQGSLWYVESVLVHVLNSAIAWPRRVYVSFERLVGKQYLTYWVTHSLSFRGSENLNMCCFRGAADRDGDFAPPPYSEWSVIRALPDMPLLPNDRLHVNIAHGDPANDAMSVYVIVHEVTS